jgi:ribonuclease Z
MTEAGADLTNLSALLITHHHSDHLLGIADIVITRWAAHGPSGCPPLDMYCPAGPAVDFLEHLFDHLEPDIQSRIGVSGYPIRPEPDISTFEPTADEPVAVATIGDIDIQAVAVDHGDLEPAVAYRFTTPDGVIVISGDTTICPQLELFAAGADILVHEAFSSDMMLAAGQPPSRVENLAHHHADARDVGEMAGRLGVPELIITHMVPSPQTPEAIDTFERAIRAGGYAGNLTIADDLHTATIDSQGAT